MSSIGSTSFWQQDYNYWHNSSFYDQDQQYLQQQQALSQVQESDASLMTAMGDAVTNASAGISSIANKEALDRTNNALVAAVQSALQQESGSSASSPAGNSTAASSSSASAASTTASNGAPATGTGSIPLSLNTSLLTLGIPPNGYITVSDGTNTTTYVSTGSDTIASLINGINAPSPTNAQVTASINTAGHLVLTGNNDTDTITVGGVFASDVGFGGQNYTFNPTPPTTASSSSTPAASSSSGSSGSSTSSNGSSSNSSSSSTATSSSLTGTASLYNASYQLQTGSSAESILSANGLSGSLLDMLA